MEGAATADLERNRLVAEQAALRRVATLVARGVPADELFGAVIEAVGRLFGADLVGLAQFVGDDAVRAVAWWAADGEHPDVSGTRPLAESSLSATVFRTGRPAREDHWENVQGPIAEILRGLGIRSSAASPVVLGGRTWGALLMHSRTPRLPAGTEARMADFTELVATAIANIDARAAVRRLADEQAALRRVATMVAREAPAADVLGAVAEEVKRLLDVGVSTLFRYEDDDTVTVVAASGDADALLPVGARFPLDGNSLVVRVRRSGEPVRIDDYAEVAGTIGAHMRQVGVRCGVGAPIIVEGRVWGGVVAVSRRPEPLPADAEARVAQFTDLAATAIANMEARTELAASRSRLVAAADDERRRVVRDLHDGAQQRLVHTVLTLNMARQAVERNEHARALLGEAAAHAQRANAELRELAHGILPSVLSHNGLRAAVDALASRLPLVVANDVPARRFPATVEATAYFVVAQALADIADHTEARSATVTASGADDTLLVQVRGIGERVRIDGRELVGLADRLDAVGGRLETTGTGVSAAIPLT